MPMGGQTAAGGGAPPGSVPQLPQPPVMPPPMGGIAPQGAQAGTPSLQEGTGAPQGGMQPPEGAMPPPPGMPPEGGPPPGPPPPPPPTPEELEEAQAKLACEKAQLQIDDWMVETGFHMQERHVISSCVRIGTGILKGPMPIQKKRKAVLKDENGKWQVKMSDEIIPSSQCVSPWKIWPDPNCGENIQDGAWIFEDDIITARKLTSLKGGDYLDDQIDKCLAEGPSLSITGVKPKPGYVTNDGDRFEIWYFHGTVKVKTMKAAGCDVKGAMKEQYPCSVTMVNDRIIKINLSPLDSGEFPYDVLVYQKLQDCWYGKGVARQGRESQRGINAATRNLMENAALSAGPQIIIDTSKIEPANGKMELTPRKVWLKKADGDEITDVRAAFTIVTIETRQAELLNIIQFWSTKYEEVTGLPQIMQGQQGNAPDTVGGMTILNNNSNAILRAFARNFDDMITEPHLNRYYEWLLLYGPEEAKGEFTLDARGSSALMERDSQNQAIAQLTQMSLNPAFKLDPELAMQENLKGLRLDAKKFELSEEKQRAMEMQQPPPDPKIEVAKMTTQARSQDLQASLQAEAERVQKEIEFKQWAKTQDIQVSENMLNAQQKADFDKHKVEMAQTSIKLNTQIALSQQDMKHDRDSKVGQHTMDYHLSKQAMTPPTEPAGRAQNGSSFQG